MSDRFLVRRLLLAAGITAVLSVTYLALVDGSVFQDFAGGFVAALGVFGWTVLILELSGKFRSPAETYDRTLEDEWDR